MLAERALCGGESSRAESWATEVRRYASPRGGHVVQHHARVELIFELYSGLPSTDPDHSTGDRDLALAEEQIAAFDRKLIALDPRTFGRQVAQGHHERAPMGFKRRLHQQI